MRAPANSATGNSGESEVCAQFERLGWGVAQNSRHDTGTDLILAARDSRRFDLRAMIGAQVKTGPHFFRRPKKDADETVGWWFFDEDRRHIDYWLGHSLPHIIVFRDQVKDVSYWAHVTEDSVIPTGKGAKILIPASQTIDSAHNNALIDVALSQLPAPSWDGSAWTGVTDLPPSAHIRYALIVPRLLAPHQNRLLENVTGAEALAMQVLLRNELNGPLTSYDDNSFVSTTDDKWSSTTLSDALTSDDWAWRATAALHSWLYDDDSATDLLKLFDHAGTPHERAAATVLSCVFHFDGAHPDDALEVLDRALQKDDYSPVDFAWLQTQRARALLQIGKAADAFEQAIETQNISQAFPSDVTAAAIAASCGQIIFEASAWERKNVGEFVRYHDVSATWWRHQVMSYALSAHLSDQFQKWTGAVPYLIPPVDSTKSRLNATALMASCAGDENGWCDAISKLARHLLLKTNSSTQPAHLADLLTYLRTAGDDRNLRHAASVVAKGVSPTALRQAAEKVDPAKSTHLTALADLKLLQAAGDFLTKEKADTLVEWCTSTLRAPQSYFDRVRPFFDLKEEILILLTQLLRSTNEHMVGSIIEAVLNLPPVKIESISSKAASLVRQIPRSNWSNEQVLRAFKRSEDDSSPLREELLKISSQNIPEQRDRIHDMAASGNLEAVFLLDDFRDISTDSAKALISTASLSVKNTINKTSSGCYTIGGYDAAHILTLLNLRHPSVAQWDEIISLFNSPTARPFQLEKTLRLLSIEGDRLSNSIRKILLPIIAPLQNKNFHPLTSDQKIGIHALASEAYAALSEEESRLTMAPRLLLGDENDRIAYARIIGRHAVQLPVEILFSLLGDNNEELRTATIWSLTKFLCRGDFTETSLQILRNSLDSGRRIEALAILDAISDHRDLFTSSSKAAIKSHVEQLINLASRHPSALVRHKSRMIS